MTCKICTETPCQCRVNEKCVCGGDVKFPPDVPGSNWYRAKVRYGTCDTCGKWGANFPSGATTGQINIWGYPE